jgi:hypothetical protein
VTISKSVFNCTFSFIIKTKCPTFENFQPTFFPVVLCRRVDRKHVRVRKMKVACVTLQPQLRNYVTVFLLRVTPTQPRDDERSRTKLAVKNATIGHQLPVPKAGR